MMTLMFATGFYILLILALVGFLKFKIWNSRVRMINASWLDESEKFKLITRWGAQF